MKISRISLFFVAALAAVSCGTYKRQGYIQDMEPGVSYSMPIQPDARIAKGDKLSIIVACSTPALAQPFNILDGVSAIDPTTGAASSENAEAKAAFKERREGFLVGNDGNINFPVLGAVQAEGLTLNQLKADLESKIVENRYIKDPVVVVNFTNFKFTIIGEGGKGIYSAPDGKMNLFDAIAMSSDLSDDAEKGEVWVVRTVDGNRKLYTVDLRTKDCYYSPAFYIQQNDMIYVKPKDTKFDSTVNHRFQFWNTFVSTFSTIINILLWSRYYLGD